MRYLLFKNQNAFALRTLAFLCALAIVAVGHAPMALAEANWVQTYYNGAHTGYNPSEKTLGVGNVPSLQLLWATSVAGGVTNFAVDDGVLYATGQGNNLVALNASTGAQLWSVNTGGNTGTNAIATGAGLVFAQCVFTDASGTPYGAVCAYKEKTGKPVWQYAVPCGCLPEAYVNSPLVFADGALYFGYDYGSIDQTRGILAVNADTGKTLWGYTVVNNSLNVGPAAVAGSDVYFYFGETPQLVAVTTANGSATWTTPLSGSDAAVSVSGGVVYASSSWTGTNATVYALKATTGATLWSYTYGTENWCGSAADPSPPAIANGIVYFHGVDGNLYALKTKNGSLVWADTPNTGQCYPFNSSPSIANGVLYINGGDNAGAASNTTAYNSATGALLWASPSPHSTLQMPPVVVNGVLYFASPGDSICESICAYSLP
jgi:outer membrane protein assembly factor BamB